MTVWGGGPQGLVAGGTLGKAANFETLGVGITDDDGIAVTTIESEQARLVSKGQGPTEMEAEEATTPAYSTISRPSREP